MLLETLFSIVLLTLILGATNLSLQKVSKCINELAQRAKANPTVTDCSATKKAADTIVKCSHQTFIINQKGISLIEILVCTLIGMTVITMTVKESGILIGHSRNQTNHIDRLGSFNYWTSIVQLALKQLDLSRVSSSFRAFENPPLYANGIPIQLSKLPFQASSGFTGVVFFKVSRILIERTKLTTGSIVKKICYNREEEKIPKSFDAFVITDSDIIEAFIEFESFPALSTPLLLCGLIDITAISKPLLFSNSKELTSEQLSRSARILIPLSERYLFYLDNEKTLRRLQFEADKIIEQQPVRASIHPVSITPRFDYPTDTYDLKILDTEYIKTLHRTTNSLSPFHLGITK